MPVTALLGACPGRISAFKPASISRRSRVTVVADLKAGKVWGAEQENAAQVRRLINRDRKEFLGNDDDILDKYNVEYGDGKAAVLEAPAAAAPPPPPSGPSASTPNPFAKPTVSAANPFGAPAPASPFGTPSTSNPFKSVVEPMGLRPDMSPDPFVKETPINFLKSITLTQVVLFLSFTLIIALMLATFNVVLNSGAIRIAGIE